MVKYSKMYQTSCFPVCLSGNLILAKEEIKLCDNWIEEIKNYGKIFYNTYLSGDLFIDCNSSCTIHQYEGQTNLELKSVDNATIVQFNYVFPSNEIQVFEEYLMFGVNDLIGTIGGHSGLFIGFSFYGFISTILDYIKKKF